MEGGEGAWERGDGENEETWRHWSRHGLGRGATSLAPDSSAYSRVPDDDDMSSTMRQEREHQGDLAEERLGERLGDRWGDVGMERRGEMTWL